MRRKNVDRAAPLETAPSVVLGGYADEVPSIARTVSAALLVPVAMVTAGCVVFTMPERSNAPSADLPESPSLAPAESEPDGPFDGALGEQAREDHFACFAFREAIRQYTADAEGAGDDAGTWVGLYEELARSIAIAATDAANGGDVEHALNQFAGATVTLATVIDVGESTTIAMHLDWETSLKLSTDACGMEPYPRQDG